MGAGNFGSMNWADKKREWLLAAFLVVGIFLVYWPALSGGFIWDDLILVKKNPLATGEANLLTVWTRGDFPVATVVTWLERCLFGEQPKGFRMVNVILHSGSALLLWAVLKQLRIPGAWLGAAMFAVHPVAVASVAWISELKNTLALPWYLLSLWSYLRFETAAAENRQARGYYAASLGFLLLALTTKTATVMLPAVALLLVWWQRRRITWQDAQRLTPHFVLALAFGLLTVWHQKHGAIQGVTVQTEAFVGRLMGAGVAFWFYLGKALWPMNLSMIYPCGEIGSLTPGNWLPTILAVGMLIGCWVTQGHRRQALGLALTVFAVSLFPVLGFFDMYFMIFARVSDHLAYVALGAITALVAAGVSRIPRQKWQWAAGGILLLGLGSLTWARAHVFASDETLWRDTIAKNPAAWNAHNNLACNLAERGDLDAAMIHFERSLELNPENASAQANLGKALAIKGQFAKAETHLRRALEFKPTDVDARSELAELLAQTGRKTEAIEQLRCAAAEKPSFPGRARLGTLLAATGRFSEAVAELRLALRQQPDSVELLNNLAWLLATAPEAAVRSGPEAVQYAQTACRLTKEQDATPVGTLAAAYAEAGDFTNAAKTAQRAIALATAAGNANVASVNQQLLLLYQGNRAYHQRPANP